MRPAERHAAGPAATCGVEAILPLLIQQQGTSIKVLGNGEESAGNAWRGRVLRKLAEYLRMLPQVLRLRYYRAIC